MRSLDLEALELTALDLRGCGRLEQLLLNCPKLGAIDATFCSALTDGSIAAALAACKALRKLVLSVCSSAGRGWLQGAGALPQLTHLDLSYTGG